MSNRQVYRDKFNWQEYFANKAAGIRQPPSALMMGDLLWRLQLVSDLHIGQYDWSSIRWNVDKVYDAHSQSEAWKNQVAHYIYEWPMSVEDFSHNVGHLNDSKVLQPGRFLIYKNTQELTKNECSVDTGGTGNKYWESGVSTEAGKRRFYLPNGCIYSAVNTTTACPIIQSGENRGQVHEDWTLWFAGPPDCYYVYDSELEEYVYRSKIHYDTWIKGTAYTEDTDGWQIDLPDMPSRAAWQGVGWRAKIDIPEAVKNIPPHLWAGERTDVTQDPDSKYAGAEWSAGQWPKGKLVRASTGDYAGIKVYRALIDIKNTLQYPAMEDEAPQSSEHWEEVPGLAVVWEAVGTSWHFTSSSTNNEWSLAENQNYLADYFPSFPGMYMFHDLVVDNGMPIAEESVLMHPSLFWPKDVYTPEKYERLVAAYKESAFTNLSGIAQPRWVKNGDCKIGINPLAITDPSKLGTCYDCRTRIGWRQEEEYPRVITIVDIDGNGVLTDLDGFNHSKIFPGTQYGSHGGVRNNIPVGFGASWSENSKITGGLQNHIEVILSDKSFRLPADGTYRANWRRKFFPNPTDPLSAGSVYYTDGNGGAGVYPDGILEKWTGTEWTGFDERESDLWDDFPDVCDECWGYNEGGIEKFLAELGRQDYYIDLKNRYTPSNMLKAALRNSVDSQYGGEPLPGESQLWAQWDLIPEGGTIRGTFKYSCGRVSNWMIEGERATIETLRKQAWNPAFTPYTYPIEYGAVYDMPCKWYGARMNTIAKIADCDLEFADITLYKGKNWRMYYPYKKEALVNDSGTAYIAKNDIVDLEASPSDNLSEWRIAKLYKFTITGDYTSSIKIGYMLHLFSGDESAIEISDLPGVVKSVYVMEIHYNATEGKTYITVTDTIDISGSSPVEYFDRIGWNHYISDRHDPKDVQFKFTEDELSYQLIYEPDPQLFIDLYDLLQLVIYKDVSVQIANGGLTATYSRDEFDDCGVSVAHSVAGKALGLFTDENLDNGYIEQYDFAFKDGYTISIGGQPNDIGTESEMNAFWYYAWAKKLTWPSDLNVLPKTILAKYRISEFYNYEFCVDDPPLVLASDDVQQAVTIAGITVSNKPVFVPYDTETPPPLHSYYFYIPMSTDGRWYKMTPQYSWLIKLAGYSTWSVNKMHLQDVTQSTVIVVLNYEDCPKEVLTPPFFHTDTPRATFLDDKPPKPKKPVHHFQPYAWLKYQNTFDNSDLENTDKWSSLKTYSINDYAWWPYTRIEVFKNITGNNPATTPLENPTDWEWIPSRLDLFITGESCRCEDLEGSLPEKYKLRGKESGYYDSIYDIDRRIDKLVHEVPLSIGSFTNKVVNSETGYELYLYYSGTAIETGDYVHIDIADVFAGNYRAQFANSSYIKIFVGEDWPATFEELSTTTINNLTKNTTSTITGMSYTGGGRFVIKFRLDDDYAGFDDVVEILSITSDFMKPCYIVESDGYDNGVYFIILDVQIDSYEETLSGKIINYTRTYKPVDWENEDVKGYNFAVQACDSAQTVQGMPADNETDLSEWLELLDIAVAGYPPDIIQGL